jgi:cytochrome c oxidase subunit 4
MSHAEHADSHHIVTPGTYLKVLAALMFLMFATVAVSYIDIGETGNLLLALAIACMKMSLIILFFMHVKYSSKLTWVFVGSSLFWLVIMFTLTLADYFTRAWHSPFTDSPYLG